MNVFLCVINTYKVKTKYNSDRDFKEAIGEFIMPKIEFG